MTRPMGKTTGAPRKAPGIAPKLLLEQVMATAPWAFTIEPTLPAADILSKAGEIDARWRKGDAGEDYFVLLLAAHFTTVATFCPTDVDVRIRQHAWSELAGRRLTSAIERVEEIARWDVRPVTARHVVLGKEVLAGHQGEWFSVMAGALGRALALGDETAAAHARDWIETELAREAKLVTLARKKGTDQQLLSVVTTVAHNLGDLSRVVETWQKTHAESELGRRYLRLGHEDSTRFDGAFVFAGELNKQRMAKENHRFLPLRAPRALRRAREFIMPFGPYFYDWGHMIGRTPALTDAERAEILLALLNMHERRTDEHGCLRAIAGMNAAFPGGAARLGKLAAPGQAMALARAGVQAALREPEAAFLKRFHADITR